MCYKLDGLRFGRFLVNCRTAIFTVRSIREKQVEQRRVREKRVKQRRVRERPVHNTESERETHQTAEIEREIINGD